MEERNLCTKGGKWHPSGIEKKASQQRGEDKGQGQQWGATSCLPHLTLVSRREPSSLLRIMFSKSLQGEAKDGQVWELEENFQNQNVNGLGLELDEKGMGGYLVRKYSLCSCAHTGVDGPSQLEVA